MELLGCKRGCRKREKRLRRRLGCIRQVNCWACGESVIAGNWLKEGERIGLLEAILLLRLQRQIVEWITKCRAGLRDVLLLVVRFYLLWLISRRILLRGDPLRIQTCGFELFVNLSAIL